MQRLPIAAYVLAGGRSSRMGQDKALLPLAGKPLVEHMVAKLRRISDEVSILSNNPELARFAPLVPDLRESCGPLGGIEAALQHAGREWTLVLPVDMPFLPGALLRGWVRNTLEQPETRIALFVVDGVPQPTVCLLHREAAAFLTNAAEQKRFKLYPVLEGAAHALADRYGAALGQILLRWSWDETSARDFIAGQCGEEGFSEGQRSTSHLWFANLNTPEEFEEAQLHLDGLEP